MYDTHGRSGVLVVLTCQHLYRSGALSCGKPNETFISVPTIRYSKNMHPRSIPFLLEATNRRGGTPPLSGEGCPAALSILEINDVSLFGTLTYVRGVGVGKLIT